MTLSLDAAVRSEIGHVRTGNEDAAFAGPRLVAVADGMGGHAAGEVASRVAIRALAPLDDDEAGADIGGQLRDALHEANETLRSMTDDNSALRGMGTTVTALLASGRRLGLAHIGDSRAYLLRAGELVQITKDHTYVQELIDAGEIAPDEASSHPRRNMLMRALDGGDTLEPDVRVREAVQGDRYLVCSDGLTGVISDETLTSVLANGKPAEAADRLVELALKAGGPDNITVIVADVVDAPSGENASRQQVAGAAAESDEPAREGGLARLSAAGRAALTRRRTEPNSDPAKRPAAAGPRGPRILRPIVVVPVVIVLLIAAGVGGTVLYVKRQWYVGIHDSHVAVFHGVEGSVAGLRLQHVRDTFANVSTLSEGDRARLLDGITTKSHASADTIAKTFQSTAAVLPTPATTTAPSLGSTPTPAVTLTPAGLPPNPLTAAPSAASATP